MTKFNPNALGGDGMVQKTRATTLQQKFGFQDDELSTPAHDAMMVWLDQNVGIFLDGWFPAQRPPEKIRDYLKRKAGEIKHYYQVNSYCNQEIGKDLLGKLEEWGTGDVPPQKYKVTKKAWEMPVMARNGFMVGFVDMAVDVQHNKIELSGDLTKWEEHFTESKFYFEVKPTIPSVGELVRQVRMYQSYLQGTFVVVSPEDRFQSILADQGIEFMKAPCSY